MWTHHKALVWLLTVLRSWTYTHDMCAWDFSRSSSSCLCLLLHVFKHLALQLIQKCNHAWEARLPVCPSLWLLQQMPSEGQQSVLVALTLSDDVHLCSDCPAEDSIDDVGTHTQGGSAAFEFHQQVLRRLLQELVRPARRADMSLGCFMQGMRRQALHTCIPLTSEPVGQ